MASISERENREIEAANASGKTPVVFIHGVWRSTAETHSSLRDGERYPPPK
jgi:hypothetical protein